MSLDDLRKQFAELQKKTSAFKLSERNAVDVLRLLEARGMVRLFHTMDGRSFMTPAQLDAEIRNALALTSGRIDVVALEPMLNIELAVIRDRLALLTQKSSSDSARLLLLGEAGDELVNQQFLDSVIEDINDRLQGQGSLTVSELARQFELPTAFLHDLLASSLARLPGAKMDGDDLFTERSQDRKLARARGIMTAVTVPCSLAELVRLHDGLSEADLRSATQELLRTGQLQGKLAVRAALYIPDVFEESRSAWVRQFFAANQYFEYAVLTGRLQLDSDPASYLATVLGAQSVVNLLSCAVSSSLQIQLEESMAEAHRNCSWLDLATLLPSVLPSGDRARLVELAHAGKPDMPPFQVLCDTSVLASEPFVQRFFADEVASFVRDHADQHLFYVAAATGTTALSSTDANKLDPRMLGATKERKARVVKFAAMVKDHIRNLLQSSDAEDVVVSGAFNVLWDQGADAVFQKTVESETDKKILLFQQQQEQQQQEQQQQEHDSNLQNSMDNETEQVDSGQQQHGQESAAKNEGPAPPASKKQRKKDRDRFQNEVYARMAIVTHLHASIDRFCSILGNGSAAAPELDRYLLKSLCQDVWSLLVRWEAKNQLSSAGRASVPIHQLMKQLADDRVQEALEALRSAKTVASFLRLFDEQSTPVFELLLRPLDKKKERTLVFSQRQLLREQLTEAVASPGRVPVAELFHKLLLFLYIKVHGHVVHVPLKRSKWLLATLPVASNNDKGNETGNDNNLPLDLLEQLFDRISEQKNDTEIQAQMYSCIKNLI